jgi:hypothetical protein
VRRRFHVLDVVLAHVPKIDGTQGPLSSSAGTMAPWVRSSLTRATLSPVTRSLRRVIPMALVLHSLQPSH